MEDQKLIGSRLLEISRIIRTQIDNFHRDYPEFEIDGIEMSKTKTTDGGIASGIRLNLALR